MIGYDHWLIFRYVLARQLDSRGANLKMPLAQHMPRIFFECAEMDRGRTQRTRHQLHVTPRIYPPAPVYRNNNICLSVLGSSKISQLLQMRGGQNDRSIILPHMNPTQYFQSDNLEREEPSKDEHQQQ
jgi:hypothetical protein